MSGIESQFKKALDVATASLGDIAQGMGRGYRMLHAYKRAEKRVTHDAAERLSRYLRDRADEFNRAADDLDAALNQEEEDG